MRHRADIFGLLMAPDGFVILQDMLNVDRPKAFLRGVRGGGRSAWRRTARETSARAHHSHTLGSVEDEPLLVDVHLELKRRGAVHSVL